MNACDDPTLPASDAALLALGLQPVPEVETLAPLFPEFELLEQVGAGGMGVVYKARHRRLDRFVALKILHPKIAEDPAFHERFGREAQAMARLTHPGTVVVHDFGDREGLFFIVMEWVDGANLRALMQQGLTAAQALSIVTQVCEALAYAHDQGVVHRDVKPENILVDRDGHVKLADFGLAKLRRDAEAPALTSSLHVLGTPRYMAPEQSERPREVDHRADIFALGVVLYELLTGQVPVGHFAPPSKLAAVDARIDDVVLRAMARNPDDRYQHASEVKSDLAGVHPRRLTRPLTPVRPLRRARPMMLAASLASAAVAMFVFRPTGSAPDRREDVRSARAALTQGTATPAPPSNPSRPLPSIEYLPSDSNLIIHVNATAIRMTPVWDGGMQKIVRQIEEGDARLSDKERCLTAFYGIEWVSFASPSKEGDPLFLDAVGRGYLATSSLNRCLRVFSDSIETTGDEHRVVVGGAQLKLQRSNDMFAASIRPEATLQTLDERLARQHGLAGIKAAYVAEHRDPAALVSMFGWRANPEPGESMAMFVNVTFARNVLTLSGEATFATSADLDSNAARAHTQLSLLGHLTLGHLRHELERDGASLRFVVSADAEFLQELLNDEPRKKILDAVHDVFESKDAE